eukprot:SAG22_NODE_375_length_11547_cov_12.885657_7_plen_145_part_00
MLHSSAFTMKLTVADSCADVGCSGHGQCRDVCAVAGAACDPGEHIHECTCWPGWSGAHCGSRDVSYESLSVDGTAKNTSSSNLQTMCITARQGDVLRVERSRYSGVGNYAVILGNLDLVIDGQDSMSTTIDCQQLGRAFFIDGS